MEINDDVLIVDDDIDFSNLIDKSLTRAGCVTDVAYSLEEAEEKVKNRKFDVIILDLTFNGHKRLSGLEFAKKLKDTDEKIGIIIVSSSSEKEVVLDALNVGVDKFVPKPVNPKVLLKVVADTAEKYQEMEFRQKLINTYAKVQGYYITTQIALEEALSLAENITNGGQ